MLHPFMASGVSLVLNLQFFLNYALFHPPAIYFFLSVEIPPVLLLWLLSWM